jgi:hypothetical protein
VHRSWTHRRFDDIKLLFFSPSQRRLAKLDGDLIKMVNELAAAGLWTLYASDTRRDTA